MILEWTTWEETGHSTNAHVQVRRESEWLFKDFSLLEADSNTQEVNYADYGNIPLAWNNNFRKIGIKKIKLITYSFIFIYNYLFIYDY